jgi:hypothetical protein
LPFIEGTSQFDSGRGFERAVVTFAHPSSQQRKRSFPRV